jgi:hypothetical protein
MNGIVNEMGTLINHNCKWIAKSGENVVIEKLTIVVVMFVHKAFASAPFSGISNGN